MCRHDPHSTSKYGHMSNFQSLHRLCTGVGWGWRTPRELPNAPLNLKTELASFVLRTQFEFSHWFRTNSRTQEADHPSLREKSSL